MSTWVTRAKYLGHKISKRGFFMIPEYVQKIKDRPVLKTAKEVAKFLGFTGYYRNFIPQGSVLTTIQLNRIKMVVKFLWNKEIEGDFIE